MYHVLHFHHVSGEVGAVSFSHCLARPEPNLEWADLGDAIAVPPMWAPQALGTQQRWYGRRTSLRMTTAAQSQPGVLLSATGRVQ